MMKNLTGRAEKDAQRLLQAYTVGNIDRGIFVGSLVDLVDRYRARGATTAVTVLRAYVEAAQALPVTVDPRFPATEATRLTKAVETVLASDLPTDMQVTRLIVGETLQAAHRAYGDTMDNMPEVDGWTRGLEADACELCQWWSRDGQVWPTDHEMPTHKGCVCHPIPEVRSTK